ncbi:hypothetical protein DMH17_07630, partial [Raoultella planticola]|nr:hypothetical protein [Raoultella planticola]
KLILHKDSALKQLSGRLKIIRKVLKAYYMKAQIQFILHVAMMLALQKIDGHITFTHKLKYSYTTILIL